jgi:hypothetical protein
MIYANLAPEKRKATYLKHFLPTLFLTSNGQGGLGVNFSYFISAYIGSGGTSDFSVTSAVISSNNRLKLTLIPSATALAAGSKGRGPNNGSGAMAGFKGWGDFDTYGLYSPTGWPEIGLLPNVPMIRVGRCARIIQGNVVAQDNTGGDNIITADLNGTTFSTDEMKYWSIYKPAESYTLSYKFVTADINTSTETVTITGGHSFVVDEAVTFSSTGALPTGMSSSTTYYIISGGLTSTTFRVSTSRGGSAFNFNGGESGTITVTSSNVGNSTMADVKTNTSGNLPIITGVNSAWADMRPGTQIEARANLIEMDDISISGTPGNAVPNIPGDLQIWCHTPMYVPMDIAAWAFNLLTSGPVTFGYVVYSDGTNYSARSDNIGLVLKTVKGTYYTDSNGDLQVWTGAPTRASRS